MLEELFSNCVFNKKLAFSGYFEQSWKTFWIFAFNFIHVVAIVLFFTSDQDASYVSSWEVRLWRIISK